VYELLDFSWMSPAYGRPISPIHLAPGILLPQHGIITHQLFPVHLSLTISIRNFGEWIYTFIPALHFSSYHIIPFQTTYMHHHMHCMKLQEVVIYTPVGNAVVLWYPVPYHSDCYKQFRKTISIWHLTIKFAFQSNFSNCHL